VCQNPAMKLLAWRMRLEGARRRESRVHST
jgi:hypothetical protein